MKESILTDRYAKAVFAASVQGSAISLVKSDFARLLAIFSERRDFFLWLSANGRERANRVAAITALSKALSFHKITSDFLLLLIQKNRIRIVDQIAERFMELSDSAEGIVKGAVLAPDKETAESIKTVLLAAVKKKVGDKVELSEKEDPELVGGAVLKIGDSLWDASIRKKLTLIKESLCR
jgi:F-type H+-transporting ATPase subunit delta